MTNILKRYKKNGVIVTGSDSVELDSPKFEIVEIRIDTISKNIHIDILHEVMQGSLTRKHARNFEVNFSGLPTNVKTTGKAFLDAIEAEILALPQYSGATEV